MGSKSPVFPIAEPHHFSDYGFDPQLDYFQVIEEARKHKKDTSRSIDTLHFKLQKPISKDHHHHHSSGNKTRRRRWFPHWTSALSFFRSKFTHHRRHRPRPRHDSQAVNYMSKSGPIYITESGSSTPYRTTSRSWSGPLAGTLAPARKGEMEIPYINLRDLNVEHPPGISSPMPIYLVT